MPRQALPVLDQPGHIVGKIGVIDRFFAVRADVDHLVTLRGQVGFEDFFQLKTTVIRANRNHFAVGRFWFAVLGQAGQAPGG